MSIGKGSNEEISGKKKKIISHVNLKPQVYTLQAPGACMYIPCMFQISTAVQ